MKVSTFETIVAGVGLFLTVPMLTVIGHLVRAPSTVAVFFGFVMFIGWIGVLLWCGMTLYYAFISWVMNDQDR